MPGDDKRATVRNAESGNPHRPHGTSGGMPFLRRIYRGYALSAVGGVVGGLWAFVEGVAGAAAFAWYSNVLSGRSTPVAGPEGRPAGPGR